MKHFLKIYFSNLRRLLMLLAVLACAGVVTDVAAGDSAVMTTTQVELKDNIESVKQSLVSALEAKNYMIINVLNVQEALQGRGIETKPVQLIEFCNLVKAYAVTRTTHEFELFAPCRLALFEENGKTIVMVLRPSFIAMTLPKETLSKEGLAALRAFDQDMRDILTAVSQGDFF
jgi:uncharacterized protein (DUF302 family)